MHEWMHEWIKQNSALFMGRIFIDQWAGLLDLYSYYLSPFPLWTKFHSLIHQITKCLQLQCMNGEPFAWDQAEDSNHPVLKITLNSSKLENRIASFYLSIPGPLSPTLAPKTFMLLRITASDKWIRIYAGLSEYASPFRVLTRLGAQCLTQRNWRVISNISRKRRKQPEFLTCLVSVQ